MKRRLSILIAVLAIPIFAAACSTQGYGKTDRPQMQQKQGPNDVYHGP